MTTSDNWEIRRYSPGDRDLWDAFAESSRNSTFLFQRGYMDYHADRFADHSLMAYKNGKLRAMLPANLTPDGTLHSHQGLTYGGWLLPSSHFDAGDMLALWEEWLQLCRASGIKAIDYKPLPWIYATQPSQEDIYALFRHGATLSSSLISTAINLLHNPGLNTMRRRQLKKVSSESFRIVETTDAYRFMKLVSDCLRERHDVAPVHTGEEMQLLKDRFPDKIRMHAVVSDGMLHAGVMVFDTATTAHCQYIASTPEGRNQNLLTALFNHLINEVYAHKNFFDFGNSNEEGGMVLNEGLLRQKASLGGSGVVYNRYLLNL